MADDLAYLSDGQKACLRLVADGLRYKEIALQTGYSPATVNTYLKQAMARMGETDRRAAARRLLDWELSQRLGYQPAALATDPPIATSEPAGWRQWLRPPPVGGYVNDLAWYEKILRMLQAAALGTVGVMAVTLLVAGIIKLIS